MFKSYPVFDAVGTWKQNSFVCFFIVCKLQSINIWIHGTLYMHGTDLKRIYGWSLP